MAEQENVTRAELHELDPEGAPVEDKKNTLYVQFNPETLKVSFANQIKPNGDQKDTSGWLYVGKGTTKLSVQLWFDVTAAAQDSQAGAPNDVRELTRRVTFFITPQKSPKDPKKYLPPGIRFLWGSFKFDGVVESMEESLDFFSPDGRPLRASISMNLTQQEIGTLRDEKFKSKAGGSGNQQTPGQAPMAQAAAGQTIQNMAANRGLGGNWQDIAAANQIENPRLLQPGRFIDLNPARKRGLKF